MLLTMLFIFFIFFGALSEASKNCLSRIQYQAAKVVSGSLHHTSAKKLSLDMGWEILQDWCDFLGLTLFYKMHNNMTRPLVKKCMPMSNTNNKYNLRNSLPYRQFKYHNKQFSKYFPYFTKRFCKLKPNIRDKETKRNRRF